MVRSVGRRPGGLANSRHVNYKSVIDGLEMWIVDGLCAIFNTHSAAPESRSRQWTLLCTAFLSSWGALEPPADGGHPSVGLFFMSRKLIHISLVPLGLLSEGHGQGCYDVFVKIPCRSLKRPACPDSKMRLCRLRARKAFCRQEPPQYFEVSRHAEYLCSHHSQMTAYGGFNLGRGISLLLACCYVSCNGTSNAMSSNIVPVFSLV